jgi:hypothetical protein
VHGRGDIGDRGTTHHDVGHDGDKSMFLYVEWPRIQGKRMAEHRNTIFWKNPLEELAQRERNEYSEEDGDGDIGVYEKLNMVTVN